MRLEVLDWALIAAYFAAIFAVAFAVSRQERSRATTSGYFLAGRNAGWVVIGASLFASNIGSEHLIGLAGSGAATGMPVAQFEILAGLIMLLLGWIFVPFYLKSGVFTMPEFLERRYSAGPRLYLAVISILGYVLTKISVTIAAGGIIFETLMGINFWTGAVVVVLATGLYTVLGGLRAVLYTDLVQMVVLLVGAVAVTLIGLEEIGGWAALRAEVGPTHFSLWRSISHPEFPWTGILFGAPILGIWYWCTDQYIVQRVLSARDVDEARRSAIFAGFLKQLPLFLFVLPGIIAFALMKTGRLSYDDPDQALPALIGSLLPAGLRGVVAAGFLAALMSSLSSVFNSCATLFTIDLYKRARPDAGERHLVIVGQVAVAGLVVLGLLWIPFIDRISGQLFTYLQSVQAYIAPPIALVFLAGLIWPKANSPGAMAALGVGFVLGIGRLILELNQEALSGPALAFAGMNFLHFAVLLFGICLCVLVAASLLTGRAPAGPGRLNLTAAVLREGNPRRRRKDLALSAVLLGVIATLWGVFS